ncbi:MAG: NirD/YgiW/YdeI family stress tolerance protein [Gammaproteobacteria bacterium]|nr:NirD/YgiW/YdeI family stress tolerance protein [Gammaproteobacteria bacterium]
MKRLQRQALAIGVLAALAAMPVAGQNDQPNPYLMPDESWISLSGQAVDVRDESFVLDYGEGTVIVEMDDWDWYNENRLILENDNVTVYGEIDDDLFETTKIEASSVYVENLGTYFYASSADEEDVADYDYWVVADPIEPGKVTVRGTVHEIDGREFTINTGLREVTVDTVTLGYNPLDDRGFHRIEKGDYVSVTGEIDNDLFEEREVMADAIVTLRDD